MGSDPSLRQLLTLVIGSVGLGYALFGRKQAHAVVLLLMVLPFLLHRFLA